jgi:hypothetical protein
MAIDAYTLCPGGTGKKIKFCCGDFLPELEKIDRMLEGEQYLACLKHVDRLLAEDRNRDRACLLAYRCELLWLTDQRQAARKAARAFLVKHPDNQIALAEAAIAAAETDARAALDWQQRAMRAAAGHLADRTYYAMGTTAGAMLRAALPVPARALLRMQANIVREDERPRQLLGGLCRSPDLPLLLREDPPLEPSPSDVPWKSRFDEAMRLVGYGDWRTVVDRLTELAAETPGSTAVWRNLATVRGWLADNAGAIEALRKYAALRAVQEDGLEDAVEAEAAAMFLSDDPLGDRVGMFKLVWTVKDTERLQELLLSSPRWHSIPFDPARMSDGENPPPKGAYVLLDRPALDSAEGLSLATMPNLMGQGLLFGRQTDREARLEVLNVAADDLPAVSQMVRELAAETVEAGAKQDLLGQWSASQKLLRTAWLPPRGATHEQLDALVAQHAREAILERWPDLKLGVLDGRSPREAAGDPKYRTRTMAAVMVLEHWTQGLPDGIDLGELRGRLGLPALGPIDTAKAKAAQLPLARLGRLGLEGLSDEELRTAYHRAAAYNIRAAVRKFAQAIIDRPSLAEADEYLDAFATLARTEDDISRAIEHIERGRRAAEKAGESSASWDLMELSFRVAAHDGQQVMRLIEHIQRHHIEEPGVGESLTQMLIDIGLLRPDGTPATLPEAPEAAMAAAEAPAAESGGLWTPDSAQPGSGGGKLWTPE